MFLSKIVLSKWYLIFPFLKFIFNWRLVLLQYCVGFCHITWISQYVHTHTHTSPLPLEPPSNIKPPSHLSGSSQSFRLSSLCYTSTSLFCAQSLQSRLMVCDPIDSSPPGFSVHGIFQARILEWVAISFSRGPSSYFILDKLAY